MKYYQIRWKHIKDCRKASGKSLFNAWCFLGGPCSECDPKVRRWCKIKNWITMRIRRRQEKIIAKQLDAREEASKYITMSTSEVD